MSISSKNHLKSYGKLSQVNAIWGKVALQKLMTFSESDNKDFIRVLID
jgi:hypothetical protein